jgi:hypothetical protein
VLPWALPPSHSSPPERRSVVGAAAVGASSYTAAMVPSLAPTPRWSSRKMRACRSVTPQSCRRRFPTRAVAQPHGGGIPPLHQRLDQLAPARRWLAPSAAAGLFFSPDGQWLGFLAAVGSRRSP